jgi:hypothetical protein
MDDAFFIALYIVVARLILSIFPEFLPIVLCLTYAVLLAFGVASWTS